MARADASPAARRYPPGWRAFEVLVSALALLGFAPLLLVIAAAIRLDSPGPALYRQRRIGQHGRPFELLKLRTMHLHADRCGPRVTGAADARVTRLGRWLRRYRLDELPQLIHVLRGEMSLIGPRPELPEYVALYTPEQRRLLERRPGITDPVTLSFLDEAEELARAADPHRAYSEQILPRKLALALRCQPPPTWRAYLAVLAATGLALLGHRRDPAPCGGSGPGDGRQG